MNFFDLQHRLAVSPAKVSPKRAPSSPSGSLFCRYGPKVQQCVRMSFQAHANSRNKPNTKSKLQRATRPYYYYYYYY